MERPGVEPEPPDREMARPGVDPERRDRETTSEGDSEAVEGAKDPVEVVGDEVTASGCT